MSKQDLFFFLAILAAVIFVNGYFESELYNCFPAKYCLAFYRVPTLVFLIGFFPSTLLYVYIRKRLRASWSLGLFPLLLFFLTPVHRPDSSLSRIGDAVFWSMGFVVSGPRPLINHYIMALSKQHDKR